jgi:hypothetical protein
MKKFTTYPFKGAVKYFNGIRFKHNGLCWELDQIITSVIDRKPKTVGSAYYGKKPVTC